MLASTGRKTEFGVVWKARSPRIGSLIRRPRSSSNNRRLEPLLPARNAPFTSPYIMMTGKTAPPFQGSIIGHGAYRYRVDKLWSQADPATTPVNNCHEMVQVSDGRLFMLTDEVRNNMLIYDKTG